MIEFSPSYIPKFSILGVDLFCTHRKFLIYNLVTRNLKIKYRRSAFGVLWTLLVPLATATIYYFVFKIVLQVNIPHYLIFILSGVLPWTFFSQTLTESVTSLLDQHDLISKIPLPTHSFPLVCSLTNLITLMISVPIILGSSFLSEIHPGPVSLYFLYFLALLFLMSYAISTVLGIAYIYLRDLKHVTSITVQLWFYATPVLYRETMIPPQFQWILSINPVGHLFVGIRKVLVDVQHPNSAELLIPLVWTVTLVLTALLVIRKFGRSCVERL